MSKRKLMFLACMFAIRIAFGTPEGLDVAVRHACEHIMVQAY
jgi:hypothetical protein